MALQEALRRQREQEDRQALLKREMSATAEVERMRKEREDAERRSAERREELIKMAQEAEQARLQFQQVCPLCHMMACLAA